MFWTVPNVSAFISAVSRELTDILVPGGAPLGRLGEVANGGF